MQLYETKELPSKDKVSNSNGVNSNIDHFEHHFQNIEFQTPTE